MKKIVYLFVISLVSINLALGQEMGLLTDRVYKEENQIPLAEGLEEYFFITKLFEGDKFLFEVKSILTFDENKFGGIEIENVEFSIFDSSQKPIDFRLAHLWDYKIMSSKTIGYIFRFTTAKDNINCIVRVNGYGYKRLPMLRAIPVELSAIRRVEPIAITTNPNKVP